MQKRSGSMPCGVWAIMPAASSADGEAAVLYAAPYADKVRPVGAEWRGGVERLLVSCEYRGAKLRTVVRPRFAHDELHRNMAAEFVYLRRERQIHKLTITQSQARRGWEKNIALEALLTEAHAHTQMAASADGVRRFKPAPKTQSVGRGFALPYGSSWSSERTLSMLSRRRSLMSRSQ